MASTNHLTSKSNAEYVSTNQPSSKNLKPRLQPYSYPLHPFWVIDNNPQTDGIGLKFMIRTFGMRSKHQRPKINSLVISFLGNLPKYLITIPEVATPAQKEWTNAWRKRAW